jgi:type 1 glutamine amidotransferase
MKPRSAFSGILAALTTVSCLHAQQLPAFKLDEAWKEKVAAVAPETPLAEPKKQRKVLIFSLATGFQHWCIPHTEAVIEILGRRSGAYESVPGTDVEVFRPERLREFDAVVLNNNCPTGAKRDLFHDVLVARIGEAGKKYESMPAAEREALAGELYRSLVDYVADGGGLVLLHGAIANFAKSDEFSELAGGSFSYHPPQQEVTLHPVCPDHPMLTCFGGKPFVHIDEPYVMGGAYERFQFAPMLELETKGIKMNKDRGFDKLPRYVAWIRTHHKGRVFFSSPSHNAQSFERPELLQFLLNGMQFAVGDLDCDATPVGPPAAPAKPAKP